MQRSARAEKERVPLVIVRVGIFLALTMCAASCGKAYFADTPVLDLRPRNLNWEGGAVPSKAYYSEEGGRTRALLYHEFGGLMTGTGYAVVMDVTPRTEEKDKYVLRHGVVMKLVGVGHPTDGTQMVAMRRLSRASFEGERTWRGLHLKYDGPVTGQSKIADDVGDGGNALQFDVTASENAAEVSDFLDKYRKVLGDEPLCRAFFEERGE